MEDMLRAYHTGRLAQKAVSTTQKALDALTPGPVNHGPPPASVPFSSSSEVRPLSFTFPERPRVGKTTTTPPSSLSLRRPRLAPCRDRFLQGYREFLRHEAWYRPTFPNYAR